MTYIHDLILMAWNYEASDLFLVEGNPGRMKTFGRLRECGEKTIEKAEMQAFWRACAVDPENTLEKDVSFSGPNKSRWRVSLHKSFGRLAATLRQVKASIPTFEALGLPDAILTEWMSHASGLVLVTGPTGCGKSTTLASCLEFINATRTGHIVTIEDPVEYVFTDRLSFFTQREVGIDTESFARGLRGALRQAPDIIMLGEIRDAESAITAVQAAETGHLVLSTLHASNAADTLERFVRLVPAADRTGLMGQLGQQLIGILSQQLLTGTEKRALLPVCEYLTVEGAVREWIRDHELEKVLDFMKRASDGRCQSQVRALATAYQTGNVPYETVMLHASNKPELERMLRGIS